MIYTYKQCVAEYSTPYNMKKKIREGRLFKVDSNLYSDEQYAPDELAVLVAKYPRAIVTLDSAFYFYGLTDVVPDMWFLATGRNDTKIRHPLVKQCFNADKILNVGLTEEKQNGVVFRIYDRERMLIEAVRNKTKMSYDYYKELIANYRKMLEKLDVRRLQDYLLFFSQKKVLENRLKNEVF